MDIVQCLFFDLKCIGQDLIFHANIAGKIGGGCHVTRRLWVRAVGTAFCRNAG